MNEIFTCTEDNAAPDEINNAGNMGLLQVYSSIGWIDLHEDDFDGVMNNCDYRIKPDK